MEKQPIFIRVDPEIQSLIPGFIENRHQDAARILKAVAEQAFETITALGHNMKGLGTAYGFDQISVLGAGLENAGRCRDSAVAAKLTQDLQDYLGRVQIVYG